VRRGTGLAAMLALDGQDLRRSGSILAAPFETGTIEVPRAASFSAVAGEFRDGVWTALERIQPEGKGGFVAIDIDEDRATCLILLCEPEAEERWAAHLTRALRHPERIDGF